MSHPPAGKKKNLVGRTSPAEIVELLCDPVPLSGLFLVAGALLVVLFVRADPTAEPWALVPLLLGLAAIVVLDVRARLIPDLITLPGLAYAVFLAAVFHKPPLGRALLGVAVAGGLALLLSIARRRGLGGGDVKLMAVLGAALGWEAALAAFLVGYVVGALTIVGVLVGRRRWPEGQFPIGAFIALSGAVIIAARG